MTLSPFEVYCIMQLSRIQVLVAVIFTVLILVSAAFLLFGYLPDFEEDTTNRVKRILKILFPFLLLFTVLFMVVPSTKTVATACILPQIINNEKVQQLPDDVMTLVHDLISEWSPHKDEKK